MSAFHISRVQAAAQVEAAQAETSQAEAAQAAADAAQSEAHSQHGPAGVMHRGQFAGYVFRLRRAVMAPKPRRPAALRRSAPKRRRPPSGGAHHAGMAHEGEQGASMETSLLPESSAVEEEELAASLDIDAMGQQEDSHDGMQEQASRHRLLTLQWRLGSRSRPDAGAGLLPWLQAAGGADAQALWSHAAPHLAVRAEDLARALVGALVGINTPDAPAQAGPGATALQLAAVRAYLMRAQEAGVESRSLATLDRVKRALLESRRDAVPRPAVAVPDEAQQNRNLLLPLKLLNADRPRTAAQVQQACSRLELSCEVGLMADKKGCVA